MTANTISKEELKQPDSFQRFFDCFARFCKNHAKKIWIGLIILLLGAGGVLVQKKRYKAMNAKAANAYASAVAQIPADSDASKTKEGWQPFLDSAQSFLDTYAQSSMAPLMKLQYAKALLQVEDYTQALQLYQQAEKQLEQPYNLFAKEGIAITYQFQGKLEESLQVWKGLVAIEGNLFKDSHLWSLGLTLEKVGKHQEALAVYQRIIDDHPDSQYIAKAKTQKMFLEN